MTEPKWIHVSLDGHGTFWVEDAVLRGERSGPLAPEAHITDGELDFLTCFGSDSYAHVYPNCIMRYHQQIGVPSDLRPIDRVAVVEANALAAPLRGTTDG